MVKNYRMPKRYFKSRKYHGKCEKCGKACEKPLQYTDESNIAISWHSPYLCEQCYMEQHPNKIFTGEVPKPPVVQELNKCVREYGESDESYRDRVLEILNKYYPLERV